MAISYLNSSPSWTPRKTNQLGISRSFDHISFALVRIRRRFNAIMLKYGRLGSCYSSTMLILFILFIVLVSAIGIGAKGAAFAVVFPVSLFYWQRSRLKAVYLVDFACHKAEDERKMPIEEFLKMTEESGAFGEESLQFQRKISRRSGLGDETYLSRGITSRPPNLSMKEARAEAESVMFGAMDALLEKTNINVGDIGILIVNCSLFNPTPSLASVIVNHYKMRADIKSYNLGGMGCSAGVIAVDLAKHLLQANRDSYAIVLSMENITLNWYFGNDRSMLLCNCIFRMGSAAVLLTNKPEEKLRAKYRLESTVRTHKGAEETSYKCVYQREDAEGRVGVSLARELMAVAGDALKTNITTLGPLVLPLKEQVKFFATLVRRKVLHERVKPYIPDFGTAFEHFCIHAGGRAVLDEMERNLRLSEWQMEPSRMTLYRFGNTSSSSLWYELAYSEANGRVSRGHRVWQIAFGSGFKCNSAVWKALRDVTAEECMNSKGNPWPHKYPITLSSTI